MNYSNIPAGEKARGRLYSEKGMQVSVRWGVETGAWMRSEGKHTDNWGVWESARWKNTQTLDLGKTQRKVEMAAQALLSARCFWSRLIASGTLRADWLLGRRCALRPTHNQPEAAWPNGGAPPGRNTMVYLMFEKGIRQSHLMNLERSRISCHLLRPPHISDFPLLIPQKQLLKSNKMTQMERRSSEEHWGTPLFSL